MYMFSELVKMNQLKYENIKICLFNGDDFICVMDKIKINDETVR